MSSTEAPAPLPDAPTRRIVLHVSYDGSGFHGFAAERAQRTVQGAIEDTLTRISGGAVSSVCAGRTDTGVHTLAQVVHVDLAEEYLARRGLPLEAFAELPELARSLSNLLGPAVAVWRAYVAPEGFDARHSATARRYRYVIETDPRRDPLFRGGSWYVGEPLDLATMRLACDPLHGEHDFSAFCRQPKGREHGPQRRRVHEAQLWQRGSLLLFEIEANAFCHQMVRSIVGLLVAVGRGAARPQEVQARLLLPDRAGLPRPAPPDGLTLVAVGYPGELGGRVEGVGVLGR